MKLIKESLYTENKQILTEGVSSEFGSISDGDYCATVAIWRSGAWRAYPGKVVGNKIYTSGIDTYSRTWIRKEIAICPLDSSMISDKDKKLIEMNIASESKKASEEALLLSSSR